MSSVLYVDGLTVELVEYGKFRIPPARLAAQAPIGKSRVFAPPSAVLRIWVAKKSPQPSPMPPASPQPRQPELAGPPVSRVETPWAYSWMTMPAAVGEWTVGSARQHLNHEHGKKQRRARRKRTLEVAIAVGRRRVPDVHAHAPVLAIRRGRKVGIVGPAAVLGVGDDGVVTFATLAKVGLLEVASELVEAPAVRQVVELRRRGGGVRAEARMSVGK